MYSREVRDSQYQEINEIYLVNKLNVKKKKKKKNRTIPINAFWEKIKALDKSLAAIPFKIK